MKKIIYIIISFFLAGCSEFLEERSQDKYHPSSLEDLNELLAGSGYWDKSVAFQGIHVMDDDAREKNGQRFSSTIPDGLGFFKWEANPYYEDDDPIWKMMYKHIAVANAILVNADQFKDDELYNKIKGEAYFIRAVNYFELVNLYALPYVKATATTTLGIPLKLTNYVEDRYFSRSPIDSVYHVIVHDLQMAASLLKGVEQPSVFRANATAANALLSRVYLYMGEYEKAVQACDSVLEDSRYVLFNMNGQEPTASFTKLATSEIIFSQGGYTTPQQSAYFLKTYFFGCSSVLRDLYIDKDLRKKIFFKESSSGRAITYSNKIGVNDVKPVSDWGMIRLAEVFLNKAEAQALLGNESDAINTLQDLQKMRYSEIPEFAGSGLELIEFIRTERRLELCFEGHRWFDLRRYSVCPKYPSTQEIIHVVHEYTTREVPTEIYKLATYNVDNRGWVLPIPGYTITFNGVIMIQNEREESKKYEYIASEHEKYD